MIVTAFDEDADKHGRRDDLVREPRLERLDDSRVVMRIAGALRDVIGRL